MAVPKVGSLGFFFSWLVLFVLNQVELSQDFLDHKLGADWRLVRKIKAEV